MFTNWLAAAAAPPPPPPSLPPPSSNINTLPPDILLEIGPPPYVRYAAHSTLLSAHSGYLRSAITRSTEIDRTNNNNSSVGNENNLNSTNDHQLPIYLPNITTEQFTPLLTYMYTGFLDLNIENIFAVLLATHVLHMPRASEICRAFLARTQSEGYLGGAFLAAAAAAAVVPSSSSSSSANSSQHQQHHQQQQHHHHHHHHQHQHSNEINDNKKGIVRIIRPIASKASITSGLGFIAPPVPNILLSSHDTPFKSLFNNTGNIITTKNQLEIDGLQLNSFNLSTSLSVEENVIPEVQSSPIKSQPPLKSPKLTTLSLPPPAVSQVPSQKQLSTQQSDSNLMSSSSKLRSSSSPPVEIITLNKNALIKLSSSRSVKRSRSSSSHNHHHNQHHHHHHRHQNNNDDKNLSSKKSSPLNNCDIVEDLTTTVVNVTPSPSTTMTNVNTNNTATNSTTTTTTTTRLDNNSNKIIIDFASCDGPVRFRRVLNESYGRGGGGSAGVGGNNNHHPTSDDNNKIIERSHLNVATSFHVQMAKTINEQRILQQQKQQNLHQQQLSDNESENSQEIINVLSPSTTSNTTTVINTNSNNINNGNKPPTEDVYSCIYCKHTFKSQYCYQKHAKRHINPLALVSGGVGGGGGIIHNSNGSIVDDNNSDMIVETIDSGSEEKDDKSGDDGHQSVYGSSNNNNTSGNINCGSVRSVDAIGASGTNTNGTNSIYPTTTSSSTNIRREVRPLDMNVQYYPCKTCGSKFPSYYFVHKHRKLCHANEEN